MKKAKRILLSLVLAGLSCAGAWAAIGASRLPVEVADSGSPDPCPGPSPSPSPQEP